MSPREFAFPQLDRALVRVHELLHDGQPDAGATHQPALRGGRLIERVEDPRTLFGRRAGPGVGDVEQQVTAAVRSMALGLAPRRVLVNCLSPGMVQIEMTDASGSRMSEEQWARDASARYG